MIFREKTVIKILLCVWCFSTLQFSVNIQIGSDLKND